MEKSTVVGGMGSCNRKIILDLTITKNLRGVLAIRTFNFLLQCFKRSLSTKYSGLATFPLNPCCNLNLAIFKNYVIIS